MIYGPEMTLGEARAEYFRRSGFGADGGYSERWIKVKVWRFPIWFPNTEGRVRAVKLHDLHHVLTEYPTTWRGEAEISAWELGSGGLNRYWVGWWLDLMSAAQGLIVNPSGVYHAFLRGRRTKNLFSEEFDIGMLDVLVGEYRCRLDLERELEAQGPSDIGAFVFWMAISSFTYLVSVVLPLVLAAMIAYRVFLV